MRKYQQFREKYNDFHDSTPDFIQLFAWLLFGGLVVGVLIVAMINVQPYIEIAANLLNSFRIPVLSAFDLSRLPIIGSFIGQMRGFLVVLIALIITWLAYQQGGRNGVYVIAAFFFFTVLGGIQTAVGAFMWFIVQGLQIFWLVLLIDEQANTGALKKSEQIGSRFEGKKYSHRRDKSMVERIKSIPYFFIRWSGLLALGAYTFDLIINSAKYPPAKDLETFAKAVSLGKWELINQDMFNALMIALFAVEALAVLAIVVWMWIDARKAGKEEV